MILDTQLENWFTYHSPASPEQAAAYKAISAAGFKFARVVVQHTPPSADQTTAVRKIREAVMTANASVACKGQ